LLLQIALSLGEFAESAAVQSLARLARVYGDVRWMDTAIATSVGQRENLLVAELVAEPGKSGDLTEKLVATIAARGDEAQVAKTLELFAGHESHPLFAQILESTLTRAGRELERIKVDPPETLSGDELKRIEGKVPQFTAALSEERDASRGRELFVEHCASCHVAKGLGSVMGPNLDSEFQRAEETILRDILFPNETITAGYETIRLEMREGTDAVGVRSSESPTSYSLKLPGGTEMTFLRRKIRGVHTHNVSLMPSTFADVLQPEEVANIIEFVRSR